MTLTQQQPQTASAKRVAGKVALVTGGSRGIGAAIALRLAEEGATVAVNYNSNRSAADQVVRRITELGSRAVAIQANVSAEDESVKLVEEIARTFGKIDILVNNAGVHEAAVVDKITPQQVDHLFGVNVKGVIATTVAALKNFSDGGRIINISSGAARVAMPGMSVYSATKAALDTLTRVWAQELGARQITVNGVAPGTTVSDMYQAAVDPEMEQAFIEKTALKRIGQPDDIAAVVAFLASDDGRWVTGQTIAADGGLNI
ncbi:MAG: glucose 1-dehydrogenase [Candidatus Melainabacteria bacterium]|nr:glucose 1-dehydrogenase [Candidatus Melainabacteria bacterium]